MAMIVRMDFYMLKRAHVHVMRFSGSVLTCPSVTLPKYEGFEDMM